MTERELVDRARAGDQDAFGTLVEDNQRRIYSLCLRMTGDREEAADLTQEAFLNAWRGLGSFQGESSFSTWVYRLAANACIDSLRRRRRQREAMGELLSLDESWEEGESARWEAADPAPTPQQALEGRELREAVEDGLRRLPDHYRQVLVLRELSGLSYQEIAGSLELDLGTVKSRIARARLALRKILLESGNFFSPSSSIPREKRGKE